MSLLKLSLPASLNYNKVNRSLFFLFEKFVFMYFTEAKRYYDKFTGDHFENP